MIALRPSTQRGHTDWGWLDSRHTFSFGEYYDPNAMGFRSLRVINEDWVRAGGGFPTHPHRDMEILSYVLDGALEHKDGMGNGSVIRPGDVQRMSAGTGVTHSEFNQSMREPVHFLQIWILPIAQGSEPGYEQVHFSEEERRGGLRLVASRDGRDGSVAIDQDLALYAAILDVGEVREHELVGERHAWLQVARGSVTINDQIIRQGDGAAISAETSLRIGGKEPTSEVLLFDIG